MTNSITDIETAAILTSCGQYFDYMHPDQSNFDIDAIAHHLARLCRFSGAVSVPLYSVAQHCVLVSHLVPTVHARVALLHDAAEAFVGDVVRPLKQLLPDYKAIEARVEAAVLDRFGCSLPYPRAVHVADQVARQLEQQAFMPPPPHGDWPTPDFSVLRWRTINKLMAPLDAAWAERAYLARYAELASDADLENTKAKIASLSTS